MVSVFKSVPDKQKRCGYNVDNDAKCETWSNFTGNSAAVMLKMHVAPRFTLGSLHREMYSAGTRMHMHRFRAMSHDHHREEAIHCLWI
jgi:hypothetical protein